MFIVSRNRPLILGAVEIPHIHGLDRLSTPMCHTILALSFVGISDITFRRAIRVV